MNMEVFAECEEQKDRVKACYGDWFHKLWSGSFDQADCEQETLDFRQCVQDAMKRRKEEAKNKWNDDDTSWMDRAKEQADDFASDAKSHARQTRDRAQNEKEDAKSKAKGKASEARDKMQHKALNARDKVKDKASEASDKAQEKASDAKKNANGTISNVASKVQDTADSWAEKIKGLGKGGGDKN